MIVRNEAAMLPDCLRAARPFVDEIVVVDTGSTDTTVALAQAQGARVRHFEWCDDFSAARNVSLDAATGDFVLVLDADERITPAGGARLRALVADEPPDAPPTVTLPLIRNLDREGTELGADFMPRVWRRRPELRFTGRVHEQVGEGVPGLRRAFDEKLTIDHLGYDPQLAAERGKRARNVSLLTAELRERPDDPSLWFYLGKEHYADGDDAGALEAFERVIADGSVVNLALSARVFAAECLRALDRSPEAMALALAGLRQHPDYGELFFVAGQAALDQGLWIQAEAQFTAAQRRPSGLAAIAFRDPSIGAWQAEVGRARAVAGQGRLKEAIAAVQAVWARARPTARVELELQVAEWLFEEGEEQAAWALVEPLLGTHPGPAAPLVQAFTNRYLAVLGVDAAHTFLQRVFSAHPALLHQLPLVGAAAELADAQGDDARLAEWLQICVHLDTPHTDHYLALARLYGAAGEVEMARAVLTRLQARMA